MSAKCLQYWVRVNEIGAPQGSTMMAFPKNNPPCGAICSWVPLQTTPYIVPVGSTRCSFPGNIRYFYRLTRQGSILPNSMFETLDYPQPGKNNESCVIEYLKFCPNS